MSRCVCLFIQPCQGLLDGMLSLWKSNNLMHPHAVKKKSESFCWGALLIILDCYSTNCEKRDLPEVNRLLMNILMIFVEGFIHSYFIETLKYTQYTYTYIECSSELIPFVGLGHLPFDGYARNSSSSLSIDDCRRLRGQHTHTHARAETHTLWGK